MPTLFHVTTPTRARAILRHGFDDRRRNGLGGLWGDGVYLARDRDTALIYEDFAAYCRKDWQTLECELTLTNPFRLSVSPAQLRLDGRRYVWDAGELVFAAHSPAALAAYHTQLRAGAPACSLIRPLLETYGHDGLLIDDPAFHTALGGNQAIVYDPALITVSGSGEPQSAPEITLRMVERLSPPSCVLLSR